MTPQFLKTHFCFEAMVTNFLSSQGSKWTFQSQNNCCSIDEYFCLQFKGT